MSSERIIVLAAHPDDETLGVGGTLVWHHSRGDQTHVVVATDGVTARHKESARQEDCLRRAAARLGVESVHSLHLPDQRLDSLPLVEIVAALESVVRPLSPSILYLHHAGDVNQDHRVLHAAGLVLARPKPGCGIYTVRAYEVASSTEWTPPGSFPPFIPNCYVDISPFIDDKLAALRMYEETHESEVPPPPHPRALDSVRTKAAYRAIESGIGDYAEAFIVLRELHGRPS